MRGNVLFFPVLVAFAALIGSAMFSPAQPSAAVPVWEVTTVTPPVGPGFRPSVDKGCQCGDFAALEKRVADLESKIAAYGSARPVASNGSGGGSGSAGNAARSVRASTSGLPYGSVVISERVVSTTETTTQAAPQAAAQTQSPVRNVVCSAASGVCRAVKGVRDSK